MSDIVRSVAAGARQASQPILRPAADAPGGGEVPFREILHALPAAIYATDPDGRITYYNEAAAALWGHRPDIGTSRWCGSWKLYRVDGTPLPHDECPMAAALRGLSPSAGPSAGPSASIELIAERPDGSRIPFMPYPRLLRDASGAVTGAVNMLVDLTDRKQAEDSARQLASIVHSSADAIVSKDLDGVITSWNHGAERLFGYTAEEAVGQPVTLLIPADRHDEEPSILARIRRGERIDHYETVRQRKDGSFVDISLTVSPIRNAEGRIIGASKVARDITERRRAEEQQQLLLREMDHRIKNLFALAGGVVSLSARTATTPAGLASDVRQRLTALARAHALTLRAPKDAGAAGGPEPAVTLHALIRTIVAPYDEGAGEQAGQSPACVAISGPDVPLPRSSVTSFALLLHEFTTNAAKYGALATPTGRVAIACAEEADRFVLTWTEQGGPPVEYEGGGEGFGSLLARATIETQFDGVISRTWKRDGLVIRLSVARDRLAVSA